MVKTLFFIQDLSGGGAEKVLVNLVNNMNKKKFDITLLTLFDRGINKKYLNAEINYRYIFKKIFRGNQHILKLFSPKFLYKFFIKDDYDIVVSYMQGATTRIISGCDNSNTIKINWIHNEMTKDKLAHSYRSYKEYKKCYYQYDATIFVAESAKNIFEKETRLTKNNIVKYNTVNTDKIIKKSQESIMDIKYDKSKFNLITVGSLTKQKGYGRLLRIINELISENYNLHLYILGKGKLKNQLQSFVINNNLNEYISFLGYKKNPYKHVKKADLFVCSSYHEGYSTVVTESLVVGTPVITTRCSGMEEMLGDNEFGIIVENDKKKLYEGLKELIQNEDKLNRYKEKAKERSSYFSTEKTVKEVEKLFFELISERDTNN